MLGADGISIRLVVKTAPQFETAAVTGEVQGHAGTTPYVRWGNHAMIVVCVLLIAAAALTMRSR